MGTSSPSETAQKSSAISGSASLNGRDGDTDAQSPEDPVPKMARINWKFTTIASDLAAIVLPLAALGLVAGLYSLRGKKVDEEPLAKWRNAIIAFASIFPIAFAAIIGRLCYQIGRYKLEQGATMGHLEQLNGSRTFGGAVLSQINLGTFNLLGISLIFLWAFSPLGTQALLRTLETRLQQVTTPTLVVFKETTLKTNLAQYISSGSRATLYENFFANLGTKLSVMMSMPNEAHADTMDIWRNAKIPFVGHGMETPIADWEDLVWSASGDRFSAMIGVPISTVPVGNTTLSVESGYIELNCFNISMMIPSAGESPDNSISFGWKGPPTGGALEEAPKNANSSWQGYPRARSRNDPTTNPNWSIAIDRFVDQMWINESFVAKRYGVEIQGSSSDENLARALESPGLFINETGIEAGPTKLLFNGVFGVNGRTTPPELTAICNVRQKYVESRVNCERQAEIARQNCTVVAQRPSRKPHPPETISHLNFPGVWQKISDKAPLATRLGYADLTLAYLADPSNMVTEAFGSTFDVNGQVDGLAFSRRLSQILNTYILLSMRDYSANVNESVAWIGINATTSSELTRLEEVYFISTLWIALALASSVVFVVGGIASIVYTHLSDGPEILGYAATLVRDSKFMDLPPECSHMSSSDISMMIKKERVRYGYTELTRQGQPILGVGPEKEVIPIRVASDRAH